jgi:hypothetical protein
VNLEISLFYQYSWGEMLGRTLLSAPRTDPGVRC